MKAFFVAVDTSLARAQLAGKRRRLARLLRARSVELQTVRAAGDEASIARLALESRGAPVIALDDQHVLPEKAPWLADLVKHASDFAAHRRPRIVYVTRHTSAAGMTQALRHPLVRHYIQRDDGNRWVEAAVEATLGLVDQIQAEARAAEEPPPIAAPEIIGASPCFREAVQGVNRLLRGPYGLVTGPSGVGKLYLIRTLWRQTSDRRPVIVACGSFFKDYYVAGSHRRYGGGREDVDKLIPFLREAGGGLLILHHVELLPTAVQHELETRLANASDGKEKAVYLYGFDEQGLNEPGGHVIATSTCEPELLMRTGRLIPDLARVLQKHHVRIPTLAERGSEDMRLLCEGFLKWIAQQEGQTGAPRIERKALAVLARTPWPNNLTDLLRVLEKAFHAAKGATIRRSHLPKDLLAAHWGDGALTLNEITARAQRAAIENALEQTGGSVSKAAKLLDKDKGSLYRVMGRLGMIVRKER